MILITLPDLFDAPMEPETGISWEWELRIGWSVAGVEAFHAFNWKLRIHVESALAMPMLLQKDSPWVNSRAVLPTVTKYENQTGGEGSLRFEFGLRLADIDHFFLPLQKRNQVYPTVIIEILLNHIQITHLLVFLRAVHTSFQFCHFVICFSLIS